MGIVPPEQRCVGRHFPGGCEAAFMSYFPPEFPIEDTLLRTAADQTSHPDLAHDDRVAKKARSSNEDLPEKF